MVPNISAGTNKVLFYDIQGRHISWSLGYYISLLLVGGKLIATSVS